LVPYTVVQMVGKVNAQVRNKETGKSSIIHLDRIKESREDLEENKETAGMQQGQQQGMRARPKVASHAKENVDKQHEEARVVRGTEGAAVLTQRQDMQEEHEGARLAAAVVLAVTLRFVPFHFVPGHFVPVISSPGHFVPGHFVPWSSRPLVILSPLFYIIHFHSRCVKKSLNCVCCH
jgi:hypothetical protein